MMGAFTVGKPQEQKNEYTPVPAGTYEVILKRGYSGATKGGTETFEVTAIIRNDVDQPQKDRRLFLTFWPKCKNQEWLQKVIDQFCHAIGIPAGTEFASWNQFGEAIEGKLLRLTVVQETDDNGYTHTVPDAYWRAYEPSAKRPCNHQWKEPKAAAPAPSLNIDEYETLEDDGDCPF